MTVHIHPDARCEADSVGEGARIGAMAVVRSGSRIESRAEIGAHATIAEGVIVGSDAIVEEGARVGRGVEIGDGARIGANAVIEARDSDGTAAVTIIEGGAEIGSGAIVTAGTRVGFDSVVKPRSVVRGDVPPRAVVHGDPAAIVGYVDELRAAASVIEADAAAGQKEIIEVGVGGCQLWPLESYRDLRGSLVPLEFDDGLPFAPRRLFYVFGAPGKEVRGEHAHKACAQFLIAINGSLAVVVDDGANVVEVRLNRPDVGLFLAPRTWGTQYKFSPDALLAVMASHPYDADDYIRSFSEFQQFIAGGP